MSYEISRVKPLIDEPTPKFLVLVEARLDYPDPYAGQRGEAPAGTTIPHHYLRVLGFLTISALTEWIKETESKYYGFDPKPKYTVIKYEPMTVTVETVVNIGA